VEISARGLTLFKLPELASFNDRGGQSREHRPAHRAAADPRVRQFGRRSRDAALRRGGAGPRLALLLHHDDAEREFAYDRDFALSPARRSARPGS
jgi:hypothetical protein